MLGAKSILVAAATAFAVAQAASAGSLLHTKYHPQCGKGESPMSVVGAEGFYCVKNPACVADNKHGACPAKQDGLPFGSYCGEVHKGVYGCIPSDDDDDDDDDDDSDECGEDETSVSVDGADRDFCIKGQVCVADTKGACPGKSEDLPEGSYCGRVHKGVYGCIKGKAPTLRKLTKSKPETKPTTKPTKPDDHDADDKEDDKEDGKADDDDDSVECGEGESPMSVVGVEKIFYVKGQACVAGFKHSACPGKQEGLTRGSYCGAVHPGVYGCIEGKDPKKANRTH